MKRYLNPKARLYQIINKAEAGIILSGAEVKSVKTRGIQLGGAYVKIQEGEVFLVNAVIAPYSYAYQPDYDSGQTRKLLLGKKEISWLMTQKKKKLTIIPLSCYTRHGWIKVQLGIGRLKKKHERKKELIREEAEREMRNVLKRG
ncbi:MAG: SsrA-binding protein [Candidatus Shapirobacteria bacterium]